jgi:hypothetical protein
VGVVNYLAKRSILELRGAVAGEALEQYILVVILCKKSFLAFAMSL